LREVNEEEEEDIPNDIEGEENGESTKMMKMMEWTMA
jgi:hypothetical protein